MVTVRVRESLAERCPFCHGEGHWSGYGSDAAYAVPAGHTMRWPDPDPAAQYDYCRLNPPQPLDGAGPAPVMPSYMRHQFAVYGVPTGYLVTLNGGGGMPFETTDFTLARDICDRWAEEFEPTL